MYTCISSAMPWQVNDAFLDMLEILAHKYDFAVISHPTPEISIACSFNTNRKGNNCTI
jgi:hypothetical protein